MVLRLSWEREQTVAGDVQKYDHDSDYVCLAEKKIAEEINKSKPTIWVMSTVVQRGEKAKGKKGGQDLGDT